MDDPVYVGGSDKILDHHSSPKCVNHVAGRAQGRVRAKCADNPSSIISAICCKRQQRLTCLVPLHFRSTENQTAQVGVLCSKFYNGVNPLVLRKQPPDYCDSAHDEWGL